MFRLRKLSRWNRVDRFINRRNRIACNNWRLRFRVRLREWLRSRFQWLRIYCNRFSRLRFLNWRYFRFRLRIDWDWFFNRGNRIADTRRLRERINWWHERAR